MELSRTMDEDASCHLILTHFNQNTNCTKRGKLNESFINWGSRTKLLCNKLLRFYQIIQISDYKLFRSLQLWYKSLQIVYIFLNITQWFKCDMGILLLTRNVNWHCPATSVILKWFPQDWIYLHVTLSFFYSPAKYWLKIEKIQI